MSVASGVLHNVGAGVVLYGMDVCLGRLLARFYYGRLRWRSLSWRRLGWVVGLVVIWSVTYQMRTWDWLPTAATIVFTVAYALAVGSDDDDDDPRWRRGLRKLQQRAKQYLAWGIPARSPLPEPA